MNPLFLLVFIAVCCARCCVAADCPGYDAITLQLHSKEVLPQAAGYIAAVRREIYESRCLRVTVRTGEVERAIETVLNNTAQFGTQNTFSLLNSTDGDKLVIIGQLFQNTGFRFVWPKTSTKALCNRQVGLLPDFQLPLRAFLLLCNGSSFTANPNISDPMSWSVDAMSMMTYTKYANLLTTSSAETGSIVSPNDFVTFQDNNRVLLEDSIFVSTQWLASGQNSAIAQRFLVATFLGWAYCRDNEDQCLSYLPSGATPISQFQMREVNRLIWPTTNGIGIMSPAAFEITTRTLGQLNSLRNFSYPPPYYATIAQQALLQIATEADVTGAKYNATSLTFCSSKNGTVTICGASPISTTSSGSLDKPVGLNTIIIVVIPVCVLIAVLSAIGLFVLWRKKTKVPDVQANIGYLIDFKELRVEAKIGSGSFGDVFKGTWRETPVAVKKLRRNMTDQLEELKTEAELMLELRHPHIVLFMGCCTDPPNVCLVTEFMPKGSLFDLLHDERVDLPWERRLSMAKDTAKGLAFLHESSYLHNDLKSSNLLVSHNWVCKVTDFGLTTLKGSRTQDELLGSIYWMAPEILNNDPPSEKTDVYAFGIILWELAARAEPYESMSWAAVRVGVLKRKQRPTMPKSLDPEYMQLIRDCWHHEPGIRPTFSRIKERLNEMDINLQKQIVPNPPPIGKITIVFSDIQNSAYLWENCPNEMKEAMGVHNDIIRNTLREYRGYEIRSDGDSFMIAFAHAKDACAFSVKVTETLLKTKWNPELLMCLDNEERERVGYEEVVFDGVRVRMGMHYADCEFTRDPVTDRVDYTGPTPAKAARLSIAAQGGQILVSKNFYEEVFRELPEINKVKPRLMPVGTIYLKGFPDPELVYQILSPSIIERHTKYMTQPANQSTVIWQDEKNNIDSILFSHTMTNMSVAPRTQRNVTLTAYPRPDQSANSPRFSVSRSPRNPPAPPFSPNSYTHTSDSYTPSSNVTQQGHSKNHSPFGSQDPSQNPSPVPGKSPQHSHNLASSNMYSLMSGEKYARMGRTPRNIEQASFTIDYNELKFEEGGQIGQGSYGVVLKGKWRGQQVAIKRLLRGKIKQEILTEFYNEVEIMCNLRCPNLVLFMGACFKPPNLCIVTELMPRNLYQVLHDPKISLTGALRLKFAKDIALGMNYLHKLNLIHRDLKSNNLLVDNSWNVKITDFGFARVKTTNQTMTKCGTANWIAPEIANGEIYNEKSDVYSYAITLYEILTRQVPFSSAPIAEVLEKVLAGMRPVIPANAPPVFVKLMVSCWVHNHWDRPSFEEIVNKLDTWKESDCDFTDTTIGAE